MSQVGAPLDPIRNSIHVIEAVHRCWRTIQTASELSRLFYEPGAHVISFQAFKRDPFAWLLAHDPEDQVELIWRCLNWYVKTTSISISPGHSEGDGVVPGCSQQAPQREWGRGCGPVPESQVIPE